jgi:hypothetical protein
MLSLNVWLFLYLEMLQNDAETAECSSSELARALVQHSAQGE